MAEEGQRIGWYKDAEDGARRQKAKTKTREEIHGRGERGNVDSWCDLRFRGQRKMIHS